MFQNFRLSMAWLHTWFGLALGFVLMAAFFFGALSVFDREIDRWAIPASRFEPTPMPSYDQILKPVFESMQPNAQARDAMRGEVNGPLPERFDTPQRWGAYTTHRDPVLGLFAGYEVPNAKKPETLIWAMRTIDPRNGESLPDDHLKIGSQFFYPLHYSLTLNWMNLGYWIVGFAALIMLVALVSGVVMHRKIFRELFTFRPKKATQRSVLDLHNLTGVVALPFHFFFAFTGLVIFAGIYFPITHTQLEPLHELHEKMEAEETGLPHDRAGVAAPMASVDAMVAEAQRRWAAKGMAGDVGFLSVTHVGDANGYVSVYRAGTDRIALTGEGIHFKASTGALLREDPPRTAVDSINTFLTGLHLQHFRHWCCAGCTCWAAWPAACALPPALSSSWKAQEAARQTGRAGRARGRCPGRHHGHRHAGGHAGHADRQPPAARGHAPRLAGPGRHGTLFLLGHLAAGHGACLCAQRPVARGLPNPAWREQCWAVAAMAVTAVLLNWLTTGDHLFKTLGAGYWPVAGVDLFMLASAVLAVVVARKLKTRAAPAMPSRAAEVAHV